jgi:hypothetical protein
MVTVERLCAFNNCQNIGKHLCSGCGEEIYCSKECQKQHWPSHKVSCQSATKPEAVATAKSFEALSVKQLKNILMAKAATYESRKKKKVLDELDQIVEKSPLVEFVSEHVKYSEVEKLLGSAPVSGTGSKSSSSSGVRSSSQGRKTRGSSATPTPDQLRQQAAVMRKDPGMVKRMNPAFANMSDEQIRAYADQLEQVPRSRLYQSNQLT